MTGIDHCLETLNDLEHAFIGAVKLSKGGIGNLAVLLDEIKTLRALAEDIKSIRPEIQDLDSAEGQRLARRALELLLHVVEQV